MKPVAKAIAKGADKTLLGPQLANHFAFLEGELGKRDWFAGADFTAADVQMASLCRPPPRASASTGASPTCSASWTASRRGQPTSARSPAVAPIPRRPSPSYSS